MAEQQRGTVTVQENGTIEADSTAVILVGDQDDSFGPSGIVRAILDDPVRLDTVVANTPAFLRAVADTGVTLIATPITLRPDASELGMPDGIMKDLHALGAFAEGTVGADAVPGLAAFADRTTVVPGKVGFSAFATTARADVLRERGRRDVVIAGVLTSLCIDSTGRAADERGYRVTVRADCAAGRTPIEHDFYCANICPLYGRVARAGSLVGELALSSVT